MNGVPVARILGFEIRLHFSWVFIVAIVTVSVAGRISSIQPDIAAVLPWAIGVAGSLGFMATVVAHELAHAVVARRDGAPGTVVVVHFIGSPNAVDVVASSARAEAQVALAGPLTSAVIGGLVCVAAYALFAIAPGLGPVADVLLIVGALDLILGAVSLVPAFPLDGGRVVRAIGWAWKRDMRAGSRIAGVVGRWVGRALIIFAFAIVLAAAQLGTDIVDGVMIGLIGWFLMAYAGSVDRWLMLDRLIEGVRVGEAMEEQLETVTPQLTLDTFAASILDGTVGPALPVVQEDAVVGIVGASQVRAVPKRKWASTRTSDVMVGRPAMPVATPDQELTQVLDDLRVSQLDGLPVLDGTTLRGVVTKRSIAAIVHARATARGQVL
jgi:Zn-dependent protease/predicted transcriptional regulator